MSTAAAHSQSPHSQGEHDISIRTPKRVCEVAWFSALCSDDYEFLGVPDGELRSSFEHCSSIMTCADQLGYQNILMPSSYQVGQEPLPFAAAMAERAPHIQSLVAVRMGEIHPPMLARHLSTLDHLLKGRLTVNIISSDLPGEKMSSADRYARAEEVVTILKQAWTTDRISHSGTHYNIDMPSDPIKAYQPDGPLLYFGGISEPARELCARHCDVFLMWPERLEDLRATMQDMSARAAQYQRQIDFGLRIHVIVRDTEAEARAAADRLISRLDADTGAAIKERSQDNSSAGVLRQDALRAASQDDWIEEQLWSGIGRARSGCASAIVGSPEQVLQKLQAYMDLGIRAFILSGYPHKQECEYFGKLVLPHLPNASLPALQGKQPAQEPSTPLTTATRR